MAKYRVKLKEKKHVAEGTMGFWFEKPKNFTYRAGQTIDVNLINPSKMDAKGGSRTFSIMTAPKETRLGVTTRLTDSAFKKTLASLDLNNEVEIEGPFGTFLLHNKVERPAIIICGGIGITPFFSLVKQATHEKLLTKIYLFYSNHQPEDAVFLKDLQELEKINRNFKLIPTMTRAKKSHQTWKGEEGHINWTMIRKYVPNLKDAIYYLAGPPGMVMAMKTMLNKAKVNDENIRYEEFAGY